MPGRSARRCGGSARTRNSGLLPDGDRARSQSGSRPRPGPRAFTASRASSSRADGLRMLSFFTAPKPFTGHTAVIQRNALRSWALLPGAELILFGEEEGIDAAAAELGASHLANVARSE